MLATVADSLAVSGALAIGFAAFAALVWGTLLLVLAIFAFLLYGVVRAGGIDLATDDERPSRGNT